MPKQDNAERRYLDLVIEPTQIDGDIVARYRNQKWAILTGSTGLNSAHLSTYDFMREIVGYDLEGFFRRNSKIITRELESVLEKLLSPE